MKADRIPLHHLWAAILVTIAGKALETVPRALALATTTAAPWAVLVTGAAAFLLFWPVAATLARRPGTGLIDLTQSAGGRPLAIATALVLSGFLLAGAGLSLRQASEMAVTAMYPHTPQSLPCPPLPWWPPSGRPWGRPT